jgi:autophagy-related protein 16
MPTKAALRFDPHDAEVTSVRWDFTGRRFATAGADRKIKIWEITQGGHAECRTTLVGSNATVMSVDFDSSSTMLLGASNDYAARIWTVEDSRLRHVLTGHSEKVSLKLAVIRSSQFFSRQR